MVMHALGDTIGDDDEIWADGGEPVSAEDAEAGQLALDDGDEQLPWLEGDEDDEGEGVDTARDPEFRGDRPLGDRADRRRHLVGLA